MTTFITSDVGPWYAVPLWLIQSVSGGAVKTYVALGSKWADRDTGECHPNKNTIGKLIGCSPSTVGNHIRELESVGALERTKRYRNDGSQTSNTYRMNSAPSGNLVPPPCQESDNPLPENEQGAGRNLAAIELEPVNKNHLTILESHTSPSEKTDTKVSSKEPPAGFDEFWAAYPRKIRKSKTIAPFKSAVKRESLDAILDGVKAWSAYWKHDSTDLIHIPYPSTWLNGDDFLTPPPIQVDHDLFTKEEREQVLADANKVKAEDISRYRREGIYPYDSETLRRMGNS